MHGSISWLVDRSQAALGVLYTMFAWWARRHQGSASRRPHARRAAAPPLRHDPVHRLGGDVLRRLVLGLLRRQPLCRRGSSKCSRVEATGGHWPPTGIEVLRPLAPAAPQHADPAHLRHDGHLGAPRAPAQRPPGPEVGPGADHRARPALHLRAGLRVRARRRSASAADIYGVDLLHGDRLPRLPRHHRHDLPDRLPGPGACAAHFTPQQHFGFEAAAWYWHFVDVVWLFLFICIYVWGMRAASTH